MKATKSSPKIQPERAKQFQEKIFAWWGKNKRDFPWRQTKDPYHIIVSEFMLQQTQASRVVDKYLAFIKTFPTLESLVRADKAEIFRLWSGLGYNRRAMWLQEAANSILQMEEFPKDPTQLKKLKGIGSYTSRSILIFAFNLNLATVDTNIRRILIAEGFATEETTERELFEIAEQLVPKNRSRDYHSALMDYGALVKTATKTGIRPTSKQGKFAGSNRQYRGRIVKYLTTKKRADRVELIQECNIPPEKADSIFDSLLADSLMQKKGKEYFL
ncbi:MAG: Fe-S cluster assembly protein HesB [Candidatus Hermodarchaeota archaeon]